MNSGDTDDSLPDRKLIETCLDRIYATREFARSRQLIDLLGYLVEATLNGQGDRLKGYTIGIDVFGRKEDFDPGYDSIVRVQAGRLRKALEHYYDNAGKADPVHITVPKGKYTVRFTRPSGEAGSDAKAASTDEEALAVSPAPPPNRRSVAIAVLPFAAQESQAGGFEIADMLASELITVLAQTSVLSVTPRASSFRFRAPVDPRRVGQELGTAFLLEGSVIHRGTKFRVSISIISTDSGRALWSHAYDAAADDFPDNIDVLTSRIVQDIRPRVISFARSAIEDIPDYAKNDWELFLTSTWTPGDTLPTLDDELMSLRRARRALEINPHSGKAHSVVADKLSHLANLDPASDTEDNRKLGVEHARRALELEPDNADVVFNIANYSWNIGQLPRCIDLMKRVLEIDPHHFIASHAIDEMAFMVNQAPQWAIDSLVAKETALPRSNVARWALLTTIGLLYFNNAQYRAVVEYCEKAHDLRKAPENTLRLCAALVQLGEVDRAMRLIDDLRDYWPTIDLNHYARVAIPHQYQTGLILHDVTKVYSRLADAYLNGAGDREADSEKVVSIWRDRRNGKS